MSRISMNALAQSILAVRVMDAKQKELLAQAMKESGLTWPLITEDHLDQQSKRFAAIANFGEGLSEPLQDRSMQQYIEDHPEKELLAYVQMETANWLKRIVPEDTDKYIMLATWNIVNCIAFVPLTAK